MIEVTAGFFLREWSQSIASLFYVLERNDTQLFKIIFKQLPTGEDKLEDYAFLINLIEQFSYPFECCQVNLFRFVKENNKSSATLLKRSNNFSQQHCSISLLLIIFKAQTNFLQDNIHHIIEGIDSLWQKYSDHLRRQFFLYHSADHSLAGPFLSNQEQQRN